MPIRTNVRVLGSWRSVRVSKSIFAKAHEEGEKVLVYPELCVTGHTCADLFFSDVLLGSAREALIDFAKYTKGVIRNNCIILFKKCQRGSWKKIFFFII